MGENLSVNWNVQLSATAGNVPKGRPLTMDASGRYVIATDAARALWGGAGVFGISLDDGRSDQSVRFVELGPVPAATVGALGGDPAGVYVDCDDGVLVRTSAVTNNTIGDYRADGAVVFRPDYPGSGGTGAGFSGNAIKIQGKSVVNSSASPGIVLSGRNNVDLYWRQDGPDVRDFFPYNYLPNGTDDNSVELQNFLDAVCQTGGTRFGKWWPRIGGSFSVNYRTTRTLTIFNDTAGGLAEEWVIDGGPVGSRGLNSHLINAVPCPSGSTASVASYYSGTGRPTMRLNIGVRSDVTEANKETYIGRDIRIWNTADILNHFVVGYIVDIKTSGSDTVLVIDQPRAGAPGTDARNGAIRWRIWMPCLEIRSSGWEWRNGPIITAENPGRWGPHVEIGEPYRAGDKTTNTFFMRRFHLSGQSTAIVKSGVCIARDIVPRSGHSRYQGLNGNGELQLVETVQVDEFTLEDGKVAGVDEFCIEHHATNGQSKHGTIEDVAMSAIGRHGSYAGIGYGCPRSKWGAGNSWGPVGLPQAYIIKPNFGPLDLPVLFGGSTSGGGKVIEKVYTEGAWRLLVNPTTTGEPVTIRNVQSQFPNGVIHPSKEIVTLQGDGPLRIDMMEILQPDNAGGHIVVNTSASTKTGSANVTGLVLNGIPGWTGRRARQTAQKAGPYTIASGDTLTFKVDLNVNVVTVGVTLTNFARVGITTGIDLNEIESIQLGRLFQGAARPAGAVVAYDVGAVIQTATGLGAATPVTYVVTTAGNTAGGADPSAGWTTTIGNTATDGGVVVTAYPAFTWWGESDNYPITVQSMKNGVGSAIQITGGNINNEVQFATGGINPQAIQAQLSIDTQGFFDHQAAGTITEPGSFELEMRSSDCFPFSNFGGVHRVMPRGLTRYGTQHAIYNELRSAAGGSFTAPVSGGAAKNLTFTGGGNTITNAVTSSAANDITVADPRCTANSQVNVTPSNAAAITLGAFYVPTPTAGAFVLKFAGPPVGTETYRYHLTEPT